MRAVCDAMNAIAMIARCMRYQKIGGLPSEQRVSDVSSLGPLLARVQGEGEVEGYRDFATGEAVRNDAGECVA